MKIGKFTIGEWAVALVFKVLEALVIVCTPLILIEAVIERLWMERFRIASYVKEVFA
jgi:hypothetical protein